MKTAIISDGALARTHGTGAQILKVFASSGLPFVHFYFYTWASGASEVAPSYQLENPHHKHVGKRVAARLSRAIGTSWWQGNKLNQRRIRRLLEEEQIACDVAYVVIGSEDSAQRAVELLRYLKCPYIVHLMDLYHEGGIDPATMTGFAELLRGASTIFALNDPLRGEMERLPGVRAEIVLFGREPMGAASYPSDVEPIQIVTVGRPYSGGMALLNEAWASMKDQQRQIEVSYIGPYFDQFPASLRRVMRNHGFVSDAEYERLLINSHLAFLTGPTELDQLGRFSIPSRMADYFMAGLPVLACVAEETATASMLQPLVPGCVQWTRMPADFLTAISDYTSSSDRWNDASERSQAFARGNLSIDAMRVRIVGALSAASATGQGTTCSERVAADLDRTVSL